MVATVVGNVDSHNGNQYEVRWDRTTREVYVFCKRLVFVGMAVSVREAMEEARVQMRTVR